MKQAMNQRRKQDLELYRIYASDSEFERAFDSTILRVVSQMDSQTLEDLLSA
jgi:type I restriction enzyme, R subunit